MAEEKHFQKLLEGVESWNRWRAENPGVNPDLAGIVLERAKLQDVNFEEAELYSANLAAAQLENANLRNARLAKANLGGSRLGAAHLEGTKLWGANLERADLSNTKLAKADLSDANLRGADLSFADLSLANFRHADLSEANLAYAIGLQVDETKIVRSRFSPHADDEWSVLRRTYTGPKLAITLIFLLFFFAPLIMRAASFSVLGDVENALIEAQHKFPAAGVNIGCSDPTLEAISLKIAHEPITIRCRSRPVWWIILGFDAPNPLNFLMPVLTCLLLIYQTLRALMTAQISLMRDAEERSGFSPPRNYIFELAQRAPFSLSKLLIWRQQERLWWVSKIRSILVYPTLFRVHKLLKTLALIGAASLVLRVFEFVFLSRVILPGPFA